MSHQVTREIPPMSSNVVGVSMLVVGLVQILLLPRQMKPWSGYGVRARLFGSNDNSESPDLCGDREAATPVFRALLKSTIALKLDLACGEVSG